LDARRTGFQLTRNRLRVLIVDDNRDAADSLCMLLRLWGHDCHVAYDGVAGFRAACDFQPDCLLVDIAMPELDGYTLARTVRAQPGLERATLLALTAYSDEEYVRCSREAGFDLHLIKPTDPFEIETLMDSLSEGVQLGGETEDST
jgi:CheY-like chemotaxis protein